jgi:hypothetical protein
MSDGPAPVDAAASISLTAVGAVAAAGSVTGKLIELAGSEQLPLSAVGEPEVIVVAVVGNVCVPLVSVVEVPSRFQPLPVPVSSSTVTVNELVVDVLAPLSDPVNDTVAGGVTVSEPPEHAGSNVTITPL